MDHARPLLIKFIYIAAITMLFLSHLLIPAVPHGSSLIIALAVTAVLYLAGDLYLLPRLGALPTAIANFIIATVILALAGSFVRQPIGAGAILATAAVMGAAEWLFYRYLRDEVAAPAGEEGILASPEFLGGAEPLPEDEEGRGPGPDQDE